ncbi:MAG: hypothetical protein JOZ78_05300 [Chroococcidiopsidaceae cyanobacterium CP_BM_ER_R8_30]|nr:hypothetical protein [Chroococcidiopsidaceae cyanobacterium CP_BM_ER_R8_30]
MIAILVITTAPVIAQSTSRNFRITPTLQMKRVQLKKALTSQRQILEFSSQRKLLEPSEYQSKPIKVTTGVYISNLIDIDETNENFEIMGYLYSSWKDLRLSFDPKEKGLQQIKSYKAGDVWTPSLRFVNSQKFNVVDDYLTINNDGTVLHVETFEAKLSSPFLLKFFPFDSQALSLLVASWDYPTSQIVLEPDRISTGFNPEAYSIRSAWHFKSISQKVTSVLFPPERDSYSRLTIELKIRRAFAYYIWNFFIPVIFFNIIAWGAFWINPQKEFSSQVTIGISSILFLTTFGFFAKTGLPRVSYLIFLDGFVFLSYTSVFISLLNILMIHRLTQIGKENLALKLQKTVSFVMPISFIFCNFLLVSFLLIS